MGDISRLRYFKVDPGKILALPGWKGLFTTQSKWGAESHLFLCLLSFSISQGGSQGAAARELLLPLQA